MKIYILLMMVLLAGGCASFKTPDILQIDAQSDVRSERTGALFYFAEVYDSVKQKDLLDLKFYEKKITPIYVSVSNMGEDTVMLGSSDTDILSFKDSVYGRIEFATWGYLLVWSAAGVLLSTVGDEYIIYPLGALVNGMIAVVIAKKANKSVYDYFSRREFPSLRIPPGKKADGFIFLYDYREDSFLELRTGDEVVRIKPVR